MVASVYPNLLYERVPAKLTDTSETTVLTVGSGRLSGRTRINLLGVLVSDSSGSVDTAVTIKWTDSSDSDEAYVIGAGLEVPTNYPFLFRCSPAIPLFDGDTVTVTGASGHHVLCVVQIPFDPGVKGMA